MRPHGRRGRRSVRQLHPEYNPRTPATTPTSRSPGLFTRSSTSGRKPRFCCSPAQCGRVDGSHVHGISSAARAPVEVARFHVMRSRGGYFAMPFSRSGPAPLPPLLQNSASVLRSPRTLASWVTVLLCAGAMVDLLAAGIGLYSWSLAEELAVRPAAAAEQDFDLADLMRVRVGAFQQLCFLATAGVFIAWFHRSRRNGQVFRPDAFSQSAGWAIGGWFVPLANFFLPYRTARETWDACADRGPDGSARVSGAPVIAWWLTFIGAKILERFADRDFRNAQTVEDYAGAYAFGAVTDLLHVVAAVFAILFVGKLTVMQRAKATGSRPLAPGAQAW